MKSMHLLQNSYKSLDAHRKHIDYLPRALIFKLCKMSRLLKHYTAQWCVFNNYSLDKHRHQIWDHFLILVLKTEITNWPWILQQFTTKNRKMALAFFLTDFISKWLFWKSLFFWEKKITFHTWKKYFKVTLLLQNFKSYVFTFLALFDFKHFGGVLWP